MADSSQAMQTIRELSAYNAENGGSAIRMLAMDTTGVAGGEIDTIPGAIKLNMTVPLEYRAGFRAEELFHFKQLSERGWLGRELTGPEIEELEHEAAKFLLNSGFPRTRIDL